MKFYLLLILLGFVLTSDAAPLSETDSKDMSEFGDYFEGDMMLTEEQRKLIDMKANGEEFRNGLVDVSKRWPNKTVVYHIKDGFNPRQLEMIHYAFFDIANQSCIKFRKRRNEDEYAVIISSKSNSCSSGTGYLAHTKKYQKLNLAEKCFYEYGKIVHEILHTLGFFHMQSTYDRDDFVKIVWENVVPKKKHNFLKHTRDSVTDFGVPYDYGSVMHYPNYAFSVNGEDTVVPLKANVTIGQRKGLAESDVLKLNIMYKCPKKEQNSSVHNNTAK